MELTLLTIPACPNAAIVEERITAALAGRPGVVVRHREVAGELEAAEAGMHGSPTLLITAWTRSPRWAKAGPVVPALPGRHRAARGGAHGSGPATGTGPGHCARPGRKPSRPRTGPCWAGVSAQTPAG